MTILPELPKHWGYERLSSVAELRTSNVNKKTEEDESVVLLCNYTDVYYNDKITSEINFMKATASENEIKRFLLKVDDVVITKDSESPDDIGVPAIISENIKDLVCGYHLTILRPIEGKIKGRYLFYAVASRFSAYQFYLAANGVTRFGLTYQGTKNLRIAFPKTAEQQKIADFLDWKTGQIDALIAKKKLLIEKLKEKRIALITHTVTKGLNPNAKIKDSGIPWIGEVPEHWKVLPLKRICDVRDGTHDTPEFVIPSKDTFPLVTSKDLVTGKVEIEGAKHIDKIDFDSISKRSGVNKGDILMPMIGTVGGAVLVDIETQFAIKNIALFKQTSNCYSKWLLYVLNSDLSTIQFDLKKSGGVQGFVALGTLRNLFFPSSPIPEQTAIADFLDQNTNKIDAFIAKNQQLIEKLTEYRTALITAATTGKIDVRGVEIKKGVKR